LSDLHLRIDRASGGLADQVAAELRAAIRSGRLAGGVRLPASRDLRLGWLVAPPALAEAAQRARAVSDLGLPVIDQYALAQLIASGAYDRHLRHMRRRYRSWPKRQR